MGKASKIKQNIEKKIQERLLGNSVLIIRRSSDDKCIEVNTKDEGWQDMAEEFCKGSDGYLVYKF